MVTSTPRQDRLLKLRLQGLGRQGEALGEFEGKPVFVFGGIPGELVIAEITAERRGYIAAQVVEVVESADSRVRPPCDYFGACTGCQWQHIAYEHQLEMKREILMDTLSRVGGVETEVLPTLGSPDRLGYRNHARFTISKRGGRLGYVHKERRNHVDVSQCLLMAPWINQALDALQGHVAETTQLSLRYGVKTGSYLLQPTFRDVDVPLPSGQKHYYEEVLGHRFQVSSPSFFQVNIAQAEQMAELVMRELRLDGTQTVVDAYAGVATFAVLMADRASRVIAIEESAAALKDARVNVDGIDNVELRQSRTEDVLAEFTEVGLDAVVLDPPRSGCMPGTLHALIDAPPKRIVYVSCEPETLARDLAVLAAGPFRIEQVSPVDMFPQTHHIEAVTTLVRDDERWARLKERSRVILASSSPRRQEIVQRLGLAFEIANPEIEEPEVSPGTDPIALARARALAKAQAVSQKTNTGSVIGADTVVELDGLVLGKPGSAEDARRMLRALRGRQHLVVSAVVIMDAANGDTIDEHRVSTVTMRDYTDEEIEAYIDSGDPMDKAGSYAVQSRTFSPASDVRGCYLNVVGMPVCTTLRLATKFGLRLSPRIEGLWPELEHCPACIELLYPKPLSNRGRR